MAQPIRRFAAICLCLTFAFGIAATLFSGLAYRGALTGAASAGLLFLTFLSGLGSVSAIILYLLFSRRLRSRQLQSLEELATPFWDPPEKPAQQLSVKHLLHSLDLQRKLMEQSFQYASFGVLIVRGDFSLVYGNPQLIELTGYEPTELYALDGPALRSLWIPENEQSDDVLTQLRRSTSMVELNVYLATKSDGLRFTHVTAFPIGVDPRKNTGGFILFVQDISPAEQLRTLQKQCSFLLNSINHGVLVIDHEFQVTFANESFCQMFDLLHADVIGQPLSHFGQEIPDETDTLSLRLAQLSAESGENQSATFDMQLSGEQHSHFQITATPIRDHFQKNIGVLLHYQDRTAEQELIASMRRNDQLETVSQMAASIAHEVRNPMTSVQGFLQLMSREIEPSHVHSMYLHVMEEDLKRINSIITEYLNFSRMGTDSFEDVWIGTLLHNTYTLLTGEANLKGIQIALLMSGDNPLLIANANSLKQVLINLARNAMEAMIEQGDGMLTLAMESDDEEVAILVKDTGPGIADADLARIFSPFYTTKQTGTGLGLYICKKIIDEHNGRITVTTEEGAGTTFRIVLPRNRLFE